MSSSFDIFEPRNLHSAIFVTFETAIEQELPEIPFVENPEPSWYTDYQNIEWDEQSFQQLYNVFYESYLVWHPFDEDQWDSEWSQVSEEIFGYRPEGWEF
jgi:hypothetical protein